MLKNILENFSSPSSKFRGAPFWAWNSKLDADELHRQIKVMHEMGLGGFFMHARVGLNTPFLSDEWFKLVKNCIDDAEKLGITAYLYDEDRWPSGSAGGMVTKNKEYRIQAIAMTTALLDDDEAVYLGSFAVDNEGIPESWHKVSPEAEGNVLHFYTRHSPPESWYNDQTYLDTLNPEAVQEFIRIAYEPYAKHFQDKFGNSVGAIFTDEPNYRTALFSENAKTIVKPGETPPPPPQILPWTKKLPELFLEKFGYDILDYLPELFYCLNGEEFSRVRRDYYEMLTVMFVNSFTRQLGKWCSEHDLPLTGHMHWEDTLTCQRHQVGAAMRSYEYMQMPGVDMLTEHWQIYDTVKQCVSVAAQQDKKWRLTECYGCTGWDFPFAGHKAIGEWQYALGINFRCQHLSWYSMAGDAKRDYPASISFQSPWYKKYSLVEERFARLSAVLSEGQDHRSILVIHPIESVWGWKSETVTTQADMDAEDQKLIDLRNTLLKANLDFDYGDEEMISRLSSVENKIFTLGKAKYKAVVIPDVRTLRKTTLELLAKFRKQGGIVLYTGEIPAYVDGIKSDEAEKYFTDFEKVSLEELSNKLESVRLVSIKAEGKEIDPVLSLIKTGEDFQTIFICNVGHKLDLTEQKKEPGVLERKEEFSAVFIEWESAGAGEVYELDPDSGKYYAVNSTVRNGKRCFVTELEKLGSRLFIETAEKITVSPRNAKFDEKYRLSLPENDWNYRCHGENVLVLDWHEYAVGDENFMPAEYILNVDNIIRDRFEIPRRGGAMTQPYTRQNCKPEKHFPLKLRCNFNIETMPENICLAVERPDLWNIELNGNKLSFEDCGYWVDPALKKTVIPQNLLVNGENTIILSTTYHEYHSGLEALYILGDFGVENDRITTKPEKLALGDWGIQRFPYYADNMTYIREIEMPNVPSNPVWLKFDSWRGVAIGISVNGSEEVILGWEPYTADIAKYLKVGKNTLEITVYGHRRNAFGPFYLNEASPHWVGPLQFKTCQQKEKQLVPCGLMK